MFFDLSKFRVFGSFSQVLTVLRLGCSYLVLKFWVILSLFVLIKLVLIKEKKCNESLMNNLRANSTSKSGSDMLVVAKDMELSIANTFFIFLGIFREEIKAYR